MWTVWGFAGCVFILKHAVHTFNELNQSHINCNDHIYAIGGFLFKIDTLKLTDTYITSTQITELALYDATENCPIQFLSHSSVISLVHLHVNIKTLLCWATLLVANALIVLHSAYSISVEHTNYTNCVGEL